MSSFSPLRQPDIFERTQFLRTEMAAVYVGLRDTARDLMMAQSENDMPNMRAAFENLKRLHDQAALLNESMQRAFDREDQRRVSA